MFLITCHSSIIPHWNMYEYDREILVQNIENTGFYYDEKSAHLYLLYYMCFSYVINRKLRSMSFCLRRICKHPYKRNNNSCYFFAFFLSNLPEEPTDDISRRFFDNQITRHYLFFSAKVLLRRSKIKSLLNHILGMIDWT